MDISVRRGTTRKFLGGLRIRRVHLPRSTNVLIKDNLPYGLYIYSIHVTNGTAATHLWREYFTIRFALCQDGDHFSFRDLQQEEHCFLSHYTLKVHIIHLQDMKKRTMIKRPFAIQIITFRIFCPQSDLNNSFF